MANTNNIITLFNNFLATPSVKQQPTTTTTAVQPVDSNPFNPNPFVTKNIDMNNYAKNRPVEGGYFAGYYNGRPNIVGRRLFVEV
ncbi:MAG: hypothetical protein ACI37S_08560 [Candidatus Gastranaerophilaceae bacterium]